MKKFLIIISLISFLVLPVFAQEQQVENNDDTTEFGMIYEPETKKEQIETSSSDVYLNFSEQKQISTKKLKVFGNKKYDLTTNEDKTISPQNAYMYEPKTIRKLYTRNKIWREIFSGKYDSNKYIIFKVSKRKIFV